MNEQNSDATNGGIFGLGKENEAYARYFTGKSYLKMLSTERVPIANVTFEPGCRNFWHIHHKDSWFSHVGVEVPAEGASNEWLEPVSDEEYNRLP